MTDVLDKAWLINAFPEIFYHAITIGFFTTLEPEWTINYPYEKGPISPIF